MPTPNSPRHTCMRPLLQPAQSWTLPSPAMWKHRLLTKSAWWGEGVSDRGSFHTYSRLFCVASHTCNQTNSNRQLPWLVDNCISVFSQLARVVQLHPHLWLPAS